MIIQKHTSFMKAFKKHPRMWGADHWAEYLRIPLNHMRKILKPIEPNIIWKAQGQESPRWATERKGEILDASIAYFDNDWGIYRHPQTPEEAADYLVKEMLNEYS